MKIQMKNDTKRFAGIIAGMLAACCLGAIAAEEEPAPAVKNTPADSGNVGEAGLKGKQVALPGMVINLVDHCVDVEASVCLHQGTLELVACTKDSKEHESVIVIDAKPKHIHAGLLLLGARAGNPAMQRPRDDEGTSWISMAPKGDLIDVSLVFNNAEGKKTEYPISDFIERSDEADDQGPPGAKPANDANAKFPNSFIFAGSVLQGEGKGPPQYLSDVSGNVISVSTFGDELLCLPGINGQDDGSLMWQVNSEKLPAVGTKVILRLRPKAKADPQTEPQTEKIPPAPAVNPPEDGRK